MNDLKIEYKWVITSDGYDNYVQLSIIYKDKKIYILDIEHITFLASAAAGNSGTDWLITQIIYNDEIKSLLMQYNIKESDLIDAVIKQLKKDREKLTDIKMFAYY